MLSMMALKSYSTYSEKYKDTKHRLLVRYWHDVPEASRDEPGMAYDSVHYKTDTNLQCSRRDASGVTYPELGGIQIRPCRADHRR